jgi:hypothetical protein
MVAFSHTSSDADHRRFNEQGVNLVSDGKQLALRWGEKSFLLSSFVVAELSVETGLTDYSSMLDPVGFSHQYLRSEQLSIHLKSAGSVKTAGRHALDDIFLNAAELSVDELLKLAYQKIDKRAEQEDTTSS